MPVVKRDNELQLFVYIVFRLVLKSWYAKTTAGPSAGPVEILAGSFIYFPIKLDLNTVGFI